MLPHEHVIISSLAVIALWALPGHDASLLIWLGAGAAATVAIDLDHFILRAILPGGSRLFERIRRDPSLLLDIKNLTSAIHYPGFGVIRLYAHLIETFTASMALIYIVHPLAAPISVSLLAHCATDMYQAYRWPDTR